MGKGKRIRAERAAGIRKPNGTRWNNIPTGMMLVIPTFAQVQMGMSPHVIPVPERRKNKKASNPDIFRFVKGNLKGTMGMQVPNKI